MVTGFSAELVDPWLRQAPGGGLVLLLGLVLGSASAALSARLEFGTPLGGARSACPSCHHQIAWFDNIPIISWLILRGRCRSCQGPISAHYPVIEALTAIACIALWLGRRQSFDVTLPLALTLPLGAAAMVDLRTGRLPDILVFAIAVLGLARIVLGQHDWLDGLVSAAVLGGISLLLHRFLHKNGQPMIGLGDVKLMAASGLWLSLAVIPLYLVAAGCFGIALGLLWKTLGGDERFPFGPALAGALLTVLVMARV